MQGFNVSDSAGLLRGIGPEFWNVKNCIDFDIGVSIDNDRNKNTSATFTWHVYALRNAQINSSNEACDWFVYSKIVQKTDVTTGFWSPPKAWKTTDSESQPGKKLGYFAAAKYAKIGLFIPKKLRTPPSIDFKFHLTTPLPPQVRHHLWHKRSKQLSIDVVAGASLHGITIYLEHIL